MPQLRKLAIGAGAAILSALALGAAQSYAGLAWLTFLALIPLCLAIEDLGFGRAWAVLALFNGLHTALTAHWIRQTGTGFGWFLLAAVAYQAALTVIPAAGVWLAGRRRTADWLLLLPALWMLMELGSRRLLFGISWALVGLPLADYSVMAQIASVAAPEALSFLAVACNIALALATKTAAKTAPRKRRSWPAILQAAVLVFAAIVFGLVRTGGGSEAAAMNIGVVQPMLSQQTRWDRLENRPPLLARLNRLIDRAAQQSPSLIVLPEAALPGLVRYEPDLAAFVTAAVQRTDKPVLFGSIDRDPQGRYYNAAVLIGTDDTDAEYRKRRLVPFVEHTPWPFHYRPPDDWVQFTPGDEPTRIRLDVATSFSVAMCLEDTYPDLARDYARNGANLLIALVNTENFKDSNQALAHLRRAQLTAVAAGIPIVRAANSGISASIDAHGRILGRLAPNREQAATLPAATVAVPTLYGTLGDPGVALLLFLILTMEAIWLRSAKRSQSAAAHSGISAPSIHGLRRKRPPVLARQ